MKLQDAIIVTKGLCYIVMGGLTPLVSGLSQWANEGAWPPAINWVVILAGCGVGAATQMLAFLSQSYGNWKAERTGNTQFLTHPPIQPK